MWAPSTLAVVVVGPASVRGSNDHVVAVEVDIEKLVYVPGSERSPATKAHN